MTKLPVAFPAFCPNFAPVMQEQLALLDEKELPIADLTFNPHCISPRQCNYGEGVQFSCKFLCNETDREKIVKARDILLQQLGEPLTIKELSRKVAINECYLKKGFKELFGTTIFDFYQSQRMKHACYLLYEKGLSVTDVAFVLGYSSISHFSAAFKKHTGMKACELLR